MEMVFAARPELDLEHPGKIRDAVSTIKPDLVINAAAYTAVDRAEQEEKLAFVVNCDAAGELSKATSRSGIPMIQISTDYVFDGASAAPYGETDAPNPQTVYGRSKLAGEQAVAAGNSRHMVVRTAWVFSRYGSNFVKSMLRLAGQQDRLRVVADQYGNPTSAADVAEGLLIAARAMIGREMELKALYHLAGTGSASWFDLASHIMKLSEGQGGPAATVDPISTSEWATAALRPTSSRLDSSVFARDLGYRCRPFRQTVAEVVADLVAESRTSAA
jgi:dTDP-4-dehydrorhamnose reductase